MSDVVIRAEGLGKKYVIGHEANERYTALRDVIAQQGRRLLSSARDMAAGRALIAGTEREEFWALQDINFEIRRGEAVGIIGRNGAGKSTLLKVLSRITEPSEGKITIAGRVASLLEVGTGFHPELTGRENIYLNGAILGMTRAEIRRKFAEIVDFAGVEKFLDTPVKRYSSGMYVRLAFAVAAHLEPEILIIDEVLAVGDTEFQKKCLGKMQDVAGHGRTVLFVSHNMAAVQALCPTSILLKSGRTALLGKTAETVQAYLAHAAKPSGSAFKQKSIGLGLELVAAATRPTNNSSHNIEVGFSFAANRPGRIAHLALLLQTQEGVRVGIVDARESNLLPWSYDKSIFEFLFTVHTQNIVEGSYYLGMYIATDDFEGNIEEILEISFEKTFKNGDFVPYPASSRGVIGLCGKAAIVLNASSDREA